MFQQNSSTGTASSSHDFGRLQDMACKIAQGLGFISKSDFKQILDQLELTLRHGNGEEIALAMTILVSIVKGGESKQLIANQKLLKTVVRHFTRMAQEVQESKSKDQDEGSGMETQPDVDTSKLQFKMLSLLSLISQIIHENKGCEFPFSRSFLNNLFTISTDCVAKSTWKKEVSRILSVILEKLSERPKVLIEYGMLPRFRQILLGNFKVAEDKNSFQRLIKCVARVNGVQPYSLKELISSGAVQAVMKSFGKDVINHMLIRLNLQTPSQCAGFSRSKPSLVAHMDT